MSTKAAVIYHSEVHWLGRQTVLERFHSLRSEIKRFVKGKRLWPELSNPQWLADLAFLVDLTGRPNMLIKV